MEEQDKVHKGCAFIAIILIIVSIVIFITGAYHTLKTIYQWLN